MAGKHSPKTPRALILGVGLDSDGHKRITSGPNFALIGGSKDTHEEMTEKVIKINEQLKKRGKELHQLGHEELDEIAQEAGLRRTPPKK